MFHRRDGRRSGRFTIWKVGLFFLAAGTWIAGLLTERPVVTGAAILILLVGVAIGLFDRRPPREED